MPQLQIQGPGAKNVAAFLDMLAVSELGTPVLQTSDDGYNVLVGSYAGHVLTFDSYATHPNVLDEELDSTAAGRYQIIHPNWVVYQRTLNLPDFGPSSQDLIAVQLLHETQAYDALVLSLFPLALARASSRWASLPGSLAGQPTHKPSDLQYWYQKAGGAMS